MATRSSRPILLNRNLEDPEKLRAPVGHYGDGEIDTPIRDRKFEPDIPSSAEVTAEIAAALAAYVGPSITAALAAYDLSTRAIQTIAAGGAAQTLDVNVYACVNLTLTADCTLTLTDPADNGVFAFVLYTTQGNGGGWDIILPGAVLFDSGTQPAPTLTLGTITKYVLTARRVLGVTTWDCLLAGDGLAV